VRGRGQRQGGSEEETAPTPAPRPLPSSPGSGDAKIPKDRKPLRIQLYDKHDAPAGEVSLTAAISKEGAGGGGLAPLTPAAATAGVRDTGRGPDPMEAHRERGAVEGGVERGGAARAGAGGRGASPARGDVVRGERMVPATGGTTTTLGGEPGRGDVVRGERRRPSPTPREHEGAGKPTLGERVKDAARGAAERVGLASGEGGEDGGARGEGGVFSSRGASSYTPPPGAIEGPDGGTVVERRLLETTEERVREVERVQAVRLSTPVVKRFVVETRYIGETALEGTETMGSIIERVVREDASADLAAGKPELQFEGRARGMRAGVERGRGGAYEGGGRGGEAFEGARGGEGAHGGEGARGGEPFAPTTLGTGGKGTTAASGGRTGLSTAEA